MNATTTRLRLRPSRILVTCLLLATSCGVGDVHRSGGIQGDPVLRWNAVGLDAVLVDHTPPMPHLPGSDVAGAGLLRHAGPCRAARVLAMLHIAIHDAYVGVTGTYPAIVVDVPATTPVSVDAAVARAAHGILAYLYPQQATALAQTLQEDLDAMPDGPAKSNGQALGTAVAVGVLAAHEADGSSAEYPTSSPHVASSDPGRHRVDPLNPAQGYLTPTWGGVTPVALADIAPHVAPQPPALTSPAYTAAFNDVKFLGGDGVTTPTLRTPEESVIGIFWAYDGTPGCGPPPRLFNQIARTIAINQGNEPEDNARLFALANVALCDAGIAAWATKYQADFWRPVVAIREADPGTGPSGAGDGNPATLGDLNWRPLGAPSTNLDTPDFTPPFPAYTSGHATFGGAFFRILERFYGRDDIAFRIGSDEFNGVNRENASDTSARPVIFRSFSSFSEAAEENGRSRIYLGVHWEFDSTFGIEQGRAIADEVYDTLSTPSS
ncbi:MAG: chloroperoxidase [Dehalococcoidia bacterium]